MSLQDVPQNQDTIGEVKLEALGLDNLPKLNEDEMEWLQAVLNCIAQATDDNGFKLQIKMPIHISLAIARSLKTNLPQYYFRVERM